MDRFERVRGVRERMDKAGLHSNMDRFERLCQCCSDMRYDTLHSNMDRFERMDKPDKATAVNVVYIPIWIDLKGYA